jgi:hypothetical protein
MPFKRKEFPMKLIFKLLIGLVICLVVIGLFRGWFSFSRTSSDQQKAEIKVSVDKVKIREDVKKAEKKVVEKVKAVVDKAKAKEGK